MLFYCGVAEEVWNKHPTAPGRYACVSPVSGSRERRQYHNRVHLPSDTLVIQDSGAFSDSPQTRLSFEAALERQIAHADKFGYAGQISHRASYDLLIDEKWVDGTRNKKRWSAVEAEAAVTTTIGAAHYLVRNNTTANILSVQGVTPQQYLACAERVMPLLGAEDMLGLGGWCIVGLYRSLVPVFYETMRLLIPVVAKNNVKRVHIWGVVYADAVGRLQWLCDEHGIELSTDSVGPQQRPVMGKWGYANWVDKQYKKVALEVLGMERARHVVAVRDWLSGIADTHYYKAPNFVHVSEKRRNGAMQLSLF